MLIIFDYSNLKLVAKYIINYGDLIISEWNSKSCTIEVIGNSSLNIMLK